MAESGGTSRGHDLIRIEPGERLVVLTRTIQAAAPEAAARLRDGAAGAERFGESCLGQALYRHRSVFQGASDQPVWSHLELSYFREMVPADAIRELVNERQPPGIDLLRAEILLVTPASFILPGDWQGMASRPELVASLEYIDVRPRHLDEYRDVMREYCGPAAGELVQAAKVGTFRAMETAAVLHRDPGFDIDWNQLHLCEVNTDGFNGFGQAFAAALHEISPAKGAEVARVFAGLDRIRTVSRWTFNDALVEEHRPLHSDAAD
jgi:hypothetical protein